MDANGTRHHLLLGVRDWERCADGAGAPLAGRLAPPAEPCGPRVRDGLAYDARRNELTLRPCLDTFRARRGDRPPALGDRRGAAADAYGNLYWIGEGRAEVRVLSSGSGRASRFWPEERAAPAPRYGAFAPRRPPAAPDASRLAGLAVTDDHYLVVGTLDPAGLLVFDLHAGGEPHRLLWPADAGPFAPFDVAARPGGGVWVLDRANARAWALDRRLHVVPWSAPAPEAVDDGADGAADDAPDEAFQPVSAGAPRRRVHRATPDGIRLDDAAPAGAVDPIAIEPLGAGRVLVLDRADGGSTLVVHRPGTPPQSIPLAPFGIAGHDVAFVPADDGASLGRLFVASDGGNQAFELDVALQGDAVALALVPAYRPMRLFGGKGLLAARGGRVYYDVADGWVPLEVQSQARYAATGTLVTAPLDGREPACVWHRVALDAVIPAGAEVLVETRAADDPRELAGAAWQREPRPYLRGDGPERPFATNATSPRPDRARGAGTWELLIQRAHGRFLQVRLTLTGDGRRTPRVRAMRVTYPRFSYLAHYLPAVYREDAHSASFLDRFLANVEGFYTTIEDRIAAAQLLFDVRSAPAESLDWLASWLGVALDPAWDERRRRLFIRHAMDFFRWRGTARGLRMAVELAVGDRPEEWLDATGGPDGAAPASRVRVVERYRTRRTPPAVLGDPTALVGPREVRVTARWRPSAGRDALNERWARATSPTGRAEFPLLPPADAGAAATWRSFATETLGFVPRAARSDPGRWRDFLARRYQRVGALAAAYGVTVGREVTFADVEPPTALPADGAPLADWFDYERVVPPMHALAHRFTVMLPMRPGATEAARRERLAHVRRVVDLERPAHTVFDVKFYWAMFRLGEARLGADTVVDRGGRAPELMRPATLGVTHLAESYVAPTPPFDATDRRIVGRDRVSGSSTGATTIAGEGEP